MSEKIGDFTDRFSPYGNAKEYKKLLAEYKRVFGDELDLAYSLANYGKVYNAILFKKKLAFHKGE